jgi:hypothetical protein
MVALGSGARYSAAEIQRDLATTWPDIGPMQPAEEGEGTMAFRVGDSDVIMGLMPAPIPWTDLEGPCATSWIWPDAAEEMKKHTQHLIVTVSSEASPVERARLLTQVVAAVIGAGQGVVGVYWGDATLVVSPPVFRDFAVEVLPHGPPLHIWIDFRVGKGDNGKSAGFTTGLAALGHMEIETLNATDPPGELRDRLIGLAGYLLENGPVINDGDTVGEDENERIRVVYSNSAFGHEGRVMRLDYSAVQPQAKKKWWKRW